VLEARHHREAMEGAQQVKQQSVADSREVPGNRLSDVDRYEIESPPYQIAGGNPSIVITRKAVPAMRRRRKAYV